MSGSSSSVHAAAADPRDEPLGLVVHGLPEPALAAERQRTGGRLRMLAVLAVCAAPVLASYLTYYVVRPQSASSAYGTLVQPPRPLPALDATTLDGRATPLRGLAGQWLLVVAGPAGDCAEACERRLFLQRQLREMTGRERDRIDKLWLVTDDAPLAPRLRAALEATPAMHVLRLPAADAERWLRGPAGPAAGGPSATPSAAEPPIERSLYVVDPLGALMMREPSDGEPARIRRDLERLLRASAGWDRPGRQPPAASGAAR